MTYKEVVALLEKQMYRRGYNISSFVKMLNTCNPGGNTISYENMRRILQKGQKPHKYHLWMFVDWLESLDTGAVPSETEFAENYLKEKME